MNEFSAINYEPLTLKIARISGFHRQRGLSILSRLQIIKSIFLGSLQYKLGIVPLNKSHEKELNKIIYNFLWKGVDQISRSKAEEHLQNGGINLERLSTRSSAAHAMMVFRLSRPDNTHLASQIFKQELKQLGGTRLLQGRPNSSLIKSLKLNNFKTTLTYFTSILPLVRPVFCHLISVNGSSYPDLEFPYNKELAHKGFIFASDYYFKDGKPVSPDHMMKLNLSPHAQMAFISVHSRLPSTWRNQILDDGGRVSPIPKNVANPLDHHLQSLEIFYKSFELDFLDAEGFCSDKPASQKVLINLFRSTLRNPPSKQQSRFPDIPDNFWPTIYTRHKITFIDTPNQAFEFNKVRDMVNGNHILYKKGKSSSEKCPYCPCLKQTNNHLFTECPVVNAFWLEIELQFYEVTGKIENIEKMLGRFAINPKLPECVAANHVILIACQVIHKYNYENKFPPTKEVVHRLIQLYYKENIFFSTKSRKKWNYFYDVWKNISLCINKTVPFSIADGYPTQILSPRLKALTFNLQQHLELLDEFSDQAD